MNERKVQHSPISPLESSAKRLHLDPYISNLVNFQSTSDDPDTRIVTFLGLTDGTPITLQDAMTSEDSEKWITSMKDEMKSMDQNDVFDFDTPCPADIKPIECKWVYKKKYNDQRVVLRFKSRIVAKGYVQKYGIDFFETYAPTLKFKSLRTLLAIAAIHNLPLFQDDVPTAFLKGDIQEDVWVKLPDGRIAKLRKTLYGLKQSPMEWNNRYNNFMLKEGFTRSKADPCIYHKLEGETPIYVAVYVDDIITAVKATDEFRKRLHEEFNMPESEKLTWYLNLQINQTNEGITISQSHYLKQKLKEFNQWIGNGVESSPLPSNYTELLMNDDTSPPADKDFPYRSMVGSLMYAILATRPDLAFPLSIVSRFLDRPTQLHCSIIRHIFKYLRQNDYVLHYTKVNVN